MEIDPRAEDVLAFWFADALESSEAADARGRVWFASDPAFDNEIRERFGELPDLALRGELDGWLGTPRGIVALVIVLDQFPRNLYRGQAQAFSYDAAARAAATLLISKGLDETVHPLEATFLYLPFEHSEDLLDQQRSLELFRALEDRVPESARALRRLQRLRTTSLRDRRPLRPVPAPQRSARARHSRSRVPLPR